MNYNKHKAIFLHNIFSSKSCTGFTAGAGIDFCGLNNYSTSIQLMTRSASVYFNSYPLIELVPQDGI